MGDTTKSFSLESFFFFCGFKIIILWKICCNKTEIARSTPAWFPPAATVKWAVRLNTVHVLTLSRRATNSAGLGASDQLS